MSRPVFRFAPSPNGNLHLGHARSALLNFDLATKNDGVFLLRIENIDATRCRPEFEAAIYEDLAWLGLTWPRPVRRQSDHLDDYRTAIERLARQGLIYRSFESRADFARQVASRRSSDFWPCDPDGAALFHRAPLAAADEARLIEKGAPFAWRLDMAKAIARAGPLDWTETETSDDKRRTVTAQPELWGDVILARKDIPTSYHLSVVLDDASQGVTDIVRGADLAPATSVHRLLQRLLDLPGPRYSHHPLILDDQGRKLSKSTGATTLRTLRAQGATPDAIRRMVGLPPAS